MIPYTYELPNKDENATTWKKLSDYKKGDIITVRGLMWYDTKWGEKSAIVTDGATVVTLPSFQNEQVKAIRYKDEQTEAINAGKMTARVAEYTNKYGTFNKVIFETSK